MFGLFVRSWILILFSMTLWAAEPSNPYVQARIVNQGASIYKNADFDSPVLGQVAAGKVFEVYPKLQGAFYRIKVGKTVGYIADNDVQLVKAAAGGKLIPVKALPKEPKNSEKKQAEIKKRRPFAMTRYVGMSYLTNFFKEQTMDGIRSEAASYIGLKMSGPDVAIEGDIPTEINVQFSSGAPNYYKNLTGVDAAGFVFMMDMQFLSVSTLSPMVLSWMGFGPLFRFSKFAVGLKDPATGKTTAYSAEDMGIGAVFSLGLGLRRGNLALRPEFKYYWEKQIYYGAGASLQIEF